MVAIKLVVSISGTMLGYNLVQRTIHLDTASPVYTFQALRVNNSLFHEMLRHVWWAIVLFVGVIL